MSADSPHSLMSFQLILFLSCWPLWSDNTSMGPVSPEAKVLYQLKDLTPDTPDRESKKICRVCSVGFSSMGTTGLRRVLSQREEVGEIPISSWVLSAIFICSQIFQWMAYIFLPLRRVVFFCLQSYNIPMLSSRTNIRKVFNLFYLRQVLSLLNKLLWFKRWQ